MRRMAKGRNASREREKRLLSCGPEWVEHVDAGADDILHIARDQCQVMYPCRRSQQPVYNWQAPPSVQSAPLVGGRGVNRQDTLRMATYPPYPHFPYPPYPHFPYPPSRRRAGWSGVATRGMTRPLRARPPIPPPTTIPRRARTPGRVIARMSPVRGARTERPPSSEWSSPVLLDKIVMLRLKPDWQALPSRQA